MHTLYVVGVGLAVLGVFLFLARQFAGRSHLARARAAWAFLPVWLVAAVVNLWRGMEHGYSFLSELPFFALVLGIPAATAVVVARRSAAAAAKGPAEGHIVP
jgi:hypothetical protein